MNQTATCNSIPGVKKKKKQKNRKLPSSCSSAIISEQTYLTVEVFTLSVNPFEATS